MEGTDKRRRYFLGSNWKCNGTTAFVKDIITHLINTLEYDPKKLGIIVSRCSLINRYL